MSSECNLDLHIPHKRKNSNSKIVIIIIICSQMKQEELSFIFENNDSLTNKREKFVKRHNCNITCQWKSLS